MTSTVEKSAEAEPAVSRSERDHLLVGLVGSGIGQSLSPLLHQREADRRGLRCIYTVIDSEALGLGSADLPAILRWASTLGYHGVNVTFPFKQDVVRLLDELSDEARALGAVNTVVFHDGRSIGYNTDWSGFKLSFERDFSDVPRERVVQLGAGGAGSAVAHAILTLGAGRLTIVDFDHAKANALAEALSAEFGSDRVTVAAPDRLLQELERADGLINATPIGMAHHPGSPVPAGALRPDLWVADVVYRPTDTQLLQDARAAGARTLHGGGMNAYQAVAAFELFSRETADAPAMLADSAALLEAGA